MRRDPQALERWAALVAEDLRATVPGEWTCSVSPTFVLSVSDGARVEDVILDADVDEDSFNHEELSVEYFEHALDDDASETVAGEAIEVLNVWDLVWPICPLHERAMTPCSGVWVCNGPPVHDLADIGRLNSAYP